ncbi:MAG: hypothetical protein K6G07_01250 [Lachnospiraceae bacterium]|nr:hypothetical protein [Lachnospiraceae bacterium]
MVLTLLTMTVCCLCSFTGAVIAPCLLVSFAFVYGLLYKKWKRAGSYVLSALPNLALVLIYVLIGMLW